MNKYLLTIFANFKNTKLVERFAKALSPIVDSPQLKFQHTDGAIIFHFESEVNQIEILDFISGVFYGLSDTYILTVLNDNTTVYMPDEMKAHLLNLNEETIPPSSDINIDKSQFDIEFDYSEMAEEFIEGLLDEFHTEVKQPTLNQILDKINEKGLNSLSPFEKQKLEEYSKS